MSPGLKPRTRSDERSLSERQTLQVLRPLHVGFVARRRHRLRRDRRRAQGRRQAGLALTSFED